jgi:hydroxyethylthiazole kinase-like uncharacterized protein yjeF
MHIVSVAEMRQLEALADERYGLTSPILMENAGKSAADILQEHLLPHLTIQGLDILVLVGPGNNGGDGLIMARHLAKADAQVCIYHWKERTLTVGGQNIAMEEVASLLENAIQRAAYIIDALLGTGNSRPLSDDMRALLKRVEQERQQRKTLRIVAVDLPTGLNADTGEVDPATLHSDMTITLACPKQGFFFFPGREYTGELYVGDIGLPAELESGLQEQMLDDSLVRDVLPRRPLDSNKGTFGKVMLFCGSPPYPGSAYLAGTAAARAGAGLITLAVSRELLPVYSGAFHEATFVLFPEEEDGSFERAGELTEHLEGYRALLIGPGLGQSAYTREVILQLLEYLRAQPEESRPHLVIDADGLNNLSALEHWWTLLPKGTIITPHPGEMGRLCRGMKVSGGGIDRLQLAREKAKEWQVTLVLKGACTIIAEPTGLLYINWLSNPALATAGTGDVLAGIIAGLLAQGVKPFDAAGAGVYLHVAASEFVSASVGSAGLLASDLLPNIPRAIVKIQNGG